ncbi:MAG: hypothetical protein ABSD70_07490 [Terracidiphilus sp.]|jgi:hypothetical protein
MATNIQSHGLMVVQGSRNSGAARSNVFRLAVPMLYAAMGVSLGTLTGVTTAFMSVPGGSAAAAGNVKTVRSLAALLLGSDSNSGAGESQKTAAVVYPVGISSHSSAQRDSATTPSGITSPKEHSAVKVERTPSLHNPPAKVPSIDTNSTHPGAPAERVPARRLAHPLTRPARTILAAMPEVSSVPSDEQLSFDPPKPSTFYSEGDAMVADYNASVGTIETSDGKTFALGETVTASDATPWNEYRSSVHYRCGESGTCVLQRAGAVAANAKQI